MKVILLAVFLAAEYYIASQYHLTILLLITIFQLILLIPLFIQPRYAKKNIKIEIQKKEILNSPAGEVNVLIKNTSFLPVNHLTLQLFYRGKRNRKNRWIVNVNVSAHSQERVKLSLTNLLPGRLDLTYEKVYLYDIFQLFSSSKKLKMLQKIYVMPEYHSLNINLLMRDAKENEDNLKMQSNASERDNFKQLRDYRTGDRMRDIHWPTSARFNQVYVKEYEGQSSHPHLNIQLDFTHNEHDDLKAYYEAVYSLLLTSIKYGAFVTVTDTEQLILPPTILHNEEDIYKLMEKLYDAPAIHENDHGDLVLTHDLVLRRHGEALYDFKEGDMGEKIEI